MTAALLTFGLAGCGPDDHSIAYWKAHRAELGKALEYCDGAFVEINKPPCTNAEMAFIQIDSEEPSVPCSIPMREIPACNKNTSP